MTARAIDKARWHVDCEAPEFKARALEHFADRWRTLLDWMHSERLIADAAFGRDVRDWMTFEVRESDFTEEGFALVRQCFANWRPAFGHAKTKRHLVQWQKKLAKLRSKKPNQPPEPTPPSVTPRAEPRVAPADGALHP